MSEPRPAYYTQCPATYYSFGEYRHCQYEYPHDGDHFHPDGGWQGTALFWDGPAGEIKPPRKTVAYIAGPMTGKKDFNFPAFEKAAQKLRGDGYEVINPAEEFGGKVDLARPVYLRKAMENLLKANMVFTLRGWKQSAGASLEVAVARELGLEVKAL